jgi:6-phosphofructokinase 1
VSSRLDRDARTVVLGHLQRGGTPTPFDRMLATEFGAHAARLVHEGRFGEMVCYRPPDIASVPIAEAVGRLSTVDPRGSAVQAARALGIGFGDDEDGGPFECRGSGSSRA